jgi:phospho-N-acetylmuramoyl-pentapeptide-transferase
MIFKSTSSFIISFIVTAAAGLALIPLLRRLKAGQTIKRNGPVWHMAKEGTPTMGGLMFIIGIGCAIIAAGMDDIKKGDWSVVAMFVFALFQGAIGFIDDLVKVKKRGNQGISGIEKIMLQLVVSIVFVLLLRNFGYLKPNLFIPFINVTIPLPEPVYFIFMAFFIVGSVNAIQITDGVDGLLSGVTLPVAGLFIAAAALWQQVPLGIFSSALLAGLLAFLLFNFNPAKVFMGDTGSLFIGGAVCALAFAFDMPLALIPLGMIYIIEALSDIIQVVYFKLTGGKRFFKMAPIHHHFEKSGWKEKKIFAVFTTVSVIFALITWVGIKNRYGL